MRQILCFSSEPWSATPGRTQQLISRLPNVEVLYIAPPERGPVRPETRYQGTIRPGLSVCTLPAPFLDTAEEGHFLFELQLRRLVRFVRRMESLCHFHSPLLWLTSPEQVHLLDRLNGRNLVYDCDRIWRGFPPAWEERLAMAADVVFAASRSLADRLSAFSPNVAVIRNGVNYPLFSLEEASTRRPLPRVTGPVLGWVGTIHPRLDLSPLLHAALSRPDWTFVLLGPVESNPLLSRLEQLRNVHLPGPRPLREIPAWLYRCNVLLDFLRTDQPQDLLSSRIYEYFSTGRPIVSMQREDQVELYPDVIYAAHSSREFLDLCRHAMEEDPAFVTRRRRSYGETSSWSARSRGVTRILNSTGLL